MPETPEAKRGRDEIKRAQDPEGVLVKTHIGGQALLEGVMMRGKYNWAVAVRTPEGGIYTEEHDLSAKVEGARWLKWPIFRGCKALVDSLALGFKALDIASEHAYDFDDEDKGEGEGEGAACAGEGECAKSAEGGKGDEDGKGGESKGMGAVMGVATVLGIVLAVALFILLPAFLTNSMVGEYSGNFILWNIVDGVLRVAVFIAYIWLISRMGDIKRMFRYHGAEHKTIHCFEHGLSLTPANAQQFPTLHIRCGTAFLVMTLILAIVVFSVVPVKEICLAAGIVDGPGLFVAVLLVRVIFIPVVAGLGYEITVKWAGNHPENRFVRVVLWPGLQMQKLTTGQPDDSMLECAIAAMELVIAREEREAARS